MLLGTLIEELRKYPREAEVSFDWGKLTPTGVDSWRGIYSELAIGYEIDGSKKNGELIDELAAAVGKEFTGYKGGEFTMNNHTRVHIDNYGEYTETHISRVSHWGKRDGFPGYVVIHTHSEGN